MDTTGHPLSPAPRAEADLPTNIQAASRAVSCIEAKKHSPNTGPTRTREGAHQRSNVLRWKYLRKKTMTRSVSECG